MFQSNYSPISILEYFKKQKELGKIKKLGFSCHCSVELLKDFLDYEEFEIVDIDSWD